MFSLRRLITAALPVAVALAALAVIAAAPAASERPAIAPALALAERSAIQKLERPDALRLPHASGLLPSALERTRDGRVRVVLETNDAAAAKAAVASLGGRVERTWRNLVQVVVPARSLRTLTQRPSVDAARAPFMMVEEAVAGEEVAASVASAWHAKSFTGKGVKVAVIDGGFSGLAQRQAEGELPTNVVTGDYCGGHFADASEHGTAVAEIVHEMAPDAQLYLLCIDTEVDLAAAVQYAASQGVQVINHSASWWGPTRGDGSGEIGDIVRAARASGILWVNSAGNYADTHWSGTFSDSNGNRIHDWAPGDEGNSFVLPDGAGICGVLKWDEWPAGVSDFDLGLFQSGTNRLLAASAGDQGGGQSPYESTCYGQESGADMTVFWAIGGYRVTTSPRLDLFSYSPSLQYAVAAGSMLDPAVAAEAFSVGALCWQSRQLEWYSSQGPTIDGRMKPEIAGHDSVSGATYGPFSRCPSAFAGTSASSPEVAGAAALVKQAYPAYGPAELQQYLMRYAKDIAPAGLDGATGAGELTLPKPPDVVAPSATALVSTGRSGRTVKLLSRVEDDSGEVRLVGQVKRNGRVVASLKRGYLPASGPTTVSLAWKAPANGGGSYQHCVQAYDRAGNASPQSCARIVLKSAQH